MRTKKMIAGIVAAMMMASAASSVIVSAADGFGVSISNTKAGAGESFELTLDMSDIPETGINGCDFGISYDSSIVTVDKVELGSLAKDISAVEGDLPSPLECNIETDVISVMYALGTTDTAYFLTGSGTFLNITGTVKETAEAGSKAEFKIVPVDRAVKPGDDETNTTVVFGYMSAEEDTTIYTPEFTDGYVEVTGSSTDEPTDEQVTEDLPVGTKYGDVNLDGDVNVADVVKLNMYLLNSETNSLKLEEKANADCVKDNIIDTSDSALIMNYVAMMVDISELGK